MESEEIVVNENIKYDIACPNCHSTKTEKNGNNTICKDCKCVISENNLEKEIVNIHTVEEKFLPNIKNRVSTNLTGRLKVRFAWTDIPSNERNTHKSYLVFKEKCNKTKEILNTTGDIGSVSEMSIAKAYNIYINIKKNSKNHRGRLKDALMGLALYYIYKENGIILSKYDIGKICSVAISAVTKANSIVDHLCRDNIEIRKSLDKSPIRLIDLHYKIKYKFTELENDDINRLKIIFNRIKNDTKVLINSPDPIAAGILYNYINVYGIKNITKDMIKTRFSISESSIRKYSTCFAYAVYK